VKRRLFNLLAAVSLAFLFSALGCHQYSERDAKLLERYGGTFVLSGEGPGRYMAPVGEIHFVDDNRALTDEDFAAVFPAVQQMDPMVLRIRGHHAISDCSVRLLNQLHSAEYIDVSGTKITAVGLSTLQLRHLQSLIVAQENVSVEGVMQLQRALPSVKVTRENDCSPQCGTAIPAAGARASSPRR
jgi:hypothetical protein